MSSIISNLLALPTADPETRSCKICIATAGLTFDCDTVTIVGLFAGDEPRAEIYGDKWEDVDLHLTRINEWFTRLV